jgi:hypothetical protein
LRKKINLLLSYFVILFDLRENTSRKTVKKQGKIHPKKQGKTHPKNTIFCPQNQHKITPKIIKTQAKFEVKIDAELQQKIGARSETNKANAMQ